MFNRHLWEFGLAPALAYPIMVMLFVGLSIFLFYKTEYAELIYAGIAFFSLIPLSEGKRNEFLKTIFLKQEYLKIRLIENFSLSLPFLIILLTQENLWIVLSLLIAVLLLAIVNWNQGSNFAFPTPFYRYPFEFTVGFRKYVLVFVLAYFLTIMSILVMNFNLGIFSLILVPLICLAFYSPPEAEFFVWVDKRNSNQFLINKIIVGILYSSILSMPIAIGLGLFFPSRLLIIGAILVLGYLYIILMILGKYSAFPNAVSVPQGLLMMFTVWLPPLLLIVIPYLFRKAQNRLRYYLL